MKLSIIIVGYNVKYFLEQCLLSVRAAVGSMDAEVFVVDNHSSDGSAAYIRSRFAEARVIENEENVGFSRANNQAVRLSTGDYVLLLNPDTVVGERVLKEACSFMDSHPEAGAVGVKMLNGAGVFLPESKRSVPSPWVAFCKMSGLSRLMPQSRIFARYHLRYLDEDRMHEVEALSGAFMLLRRSTLLQTGLLDERFFMYGEDIDLSYRIRLAGYRNYYLPLKIIHYKGESTRKDFRYVKIFYGAMLIFFDKHYRHCGRVFRLFIRGSIALHGGVFALKNVFRRKIGRRGGEREKIFDVSESSYEAIIDAMERLSARGLRFGIFHPQTGVTIKPEGASVARNDGV
jgi:GT2 family glycosyltransferase